MEREVRPALRQRLPCGRRQSAPASSSSMPMTRTSWTAASSFGAEILETSVALGGTITGEHGVGIEKLNVHVRAVQRPRSCAQMMRLQGAPSTRPRACSTPASSSPAHAALCGIRQACTSVSGACWPSLICRALLNDRIAPCPPPAPRRPTWAGCRPASAQAAAARVEVLQIQGQGSKQLLRR